MKPCVRLKSRSACPLSPATDPDSAVRRGCGGEGWGEGDAICPLTPALSPTIKRVRNQAFLVGERETFETHTL